MLPALPLPPPIRVQLLDALEATRLTIALIGDILPDVAYEDDDEALSIWRLHGYKFNLRLHEAILCELVGGVLPSVPDRVFAGIRAYEGPSEDCAWPPRVYALYLAALLAARLACNLGETCEGEPALKELDAVLCGLAVSLDNLIVHLHSTAVGELQACEAALDAILNGVTFHEGV